MRERTLRIFMLTFALGIFLAGTNTLRAQTATTVSTSIKEPINFNAMTCQSSEPIAFTGTQDTVYELVNDGTGVMKLNIHSSWVNVAGTTPSGHQFAGTNTSDETIEIDSLPNEQEIVLSQRWIGKGGEALNLVYTLTFKIQIAADGKVTSVKNSETVECKE